jgi:hypothetical protein
VAARPDVFFLPRESELRFHWIEAWLDALDAVEMRELVLDAWRMVVPQRSQAQAALEARRRGYAMVPESGPGTYQAAPTNAAGEPLVAGGLS